MNSWLRVNLEVLQQKDPDLACRVMDVQTDGLKILPTDKSEVERFWASQSLANPLLLAFYGLDLGLHLKKYLESRHPANRAILVVEKSLAAFRLALTHNDWRDHLREDSIKWIIGQEAQGLKYWFARYFQDLRHLSYSSNIENVFWMPCMERDGPYYMGVAQAIAHGSESLMNTVKGEPEDHYRGLINCVDNINVLTEMAQFAALDGIFHDQPGIVVSTGPSLNSALPTLKKLQDKAVLFCVDSALPILLSHGIRPHFVACLERVVATQRLFDSLARFEELLTDTWLVSLPLVCPETIKGYPGPKLLLGSAGFPTPWLLPNLPVESIGPSASTMAYKCLDKLGCNPIVLVGQDLAYERDSNRSHADGALDFLHQVGKQQCRDTQSEADPVNLVEGNDGTPIQTFEPYRLIADAFESLIHQSDKECLNAIFSNFGMRLSHAERVDPTDLLGRFDEDFSETRDRINNHLEKNKATSSASSNTTIQNVIVDLKTLNSELLLMLEDCSRFYHEHLPSIITEELSEAYRLKGELLEAACNKLLNERRVVTEFLWLFIMLIHLHTLLKQNELSLTSESSWDRNLKRFRMWEAWLKHVFLWSSRTAALLERGSPCDD